MTSIQELLGWQVETRAGRSVEPVGVGCRAGFVPLHAGLPEQPEGFGVLLRIRPGAGHLVASVGLHEQIPKAVAVHAVDADVPAFYQRHYLQAGGDWMADLAVTRVVTIGAFPVGGFLLAGDVAEVHRATRASRSCRLVMDAKRVCRRLPRYGLAHGDGIVAPVCRVAPDVELFLGTELDEEGYLIHACLEAI